MNAEDIKQAWLEVFPEGEATARGIMGSTCVALHAVPAAQCVNGLAENDPLRYAVWIETDADGNTRVREDRLSVLVRPPEGANLVYGSDKLRRQTIKAATHDKLVRRFRRVRAFVESADTVHDIPGVS